MKQLAAHHKSNRRGKWPGPVTLIGMLSKQVYLSSQPSAWTLKAVSRYPGPRSAEKNENQQAWSNYNWTLLRLFSILFFSSPTPHSDVHK